MGIHPVTQNPGRHFELNGELSLRGGLAFTGIDNHIFLYQEFEGRVLRQAQIWLRKGRYEITVDELKGYLVAELRSSQGELLGQGEIDLYGISPLANAQKKIKNLNLKISPQGKGLRHRVLSSGSFFQPQHFFTDAWMSISGIDRFVLVHDATYEDLQIAEGSNYGLEVNKLGYWSTTVSGQGGVATNIRLYSESVIQSLLSLADSNLDAGEYSVIWGQVTFRGQTQAGVEIQMVGAEAVGPIYFQDAGKGIEIPDKTLTKTMSNGSFAYLIEGSQLVSLRAKIGENYLPSQWIITQLGSVSQLDFDVRGHKSSSIEVTDLQSQERLATSVRLVGTETEIDFSGTSADVFSYPVGQGFMELEFEGNENYPTMRVFVPRNLRHIGIDRIGYDFMDEVLRLRALELDHDKGVVYGRFYEDDFTVVLPGLRTKIHYFNGRGELVDADVAPAGGGFVAFNLEEGIHNLVVLPESSTKIFTNRFVSERDRYSYVSPFR